MGLFGSQIGNNSNGGATPATSGGVGALDFSGNPSNVNHGPFWTTDTEYGSCYWSGWVRPLYPNLGGYFISDGSGGQHNVLIGVTTNSTHATFTGNIFDGSEVRSLNSVDNIPLGEWVHFEFIYNDGVNMYALVNGVLTFFGTETQGGVWSSAFTGVRTTLPGGSNNVLYVGGSFHNNFPGLVAKVRGIEGSTGGITTENRYIPRDYDGYVSNGSALERVDFVSDYSVDGTRMFIDAGEGFESRIHHGAFSRYDAETPYPEWTAGEIEPSTLVPTAPVTPENALVFDSFSRVNNLNLFDEVATLGSTEAGSLGVKTWTNTAGGFGVLYGNAVNYPSQAGYSYVSTDRTNVDVRVTRPNKPYAGTGILARYKDVNNYYRIWATDTAVSFMFLEAGVQTFPSGFVVSTGWTVLRVVMNGTTMTVYVDGVEAGTKTVINDGAATNHGLSGGDGAWRADDFTILAVS